MSAGVPWALRARQLREQRATGARPELTLLRTPADSTCITCGAPAEQPLIDPETGLPEPPRCASCIEYEWDVRVMLIEPEPPEDERPL